MGSVSRGSWVMREPVQNMMIPCTSLHITQQYCGVMSQSYCKGYLRCICDFSVCLVGAAEETDCGCSAEYSHQDTCLRETAHISAHLYTPTEISRNKIRRLRRHKIIYMRKCTHSSLDMHTYDKLQARMLL